MAVDLVLIPESPIELLADPPSSDSCEPELYIYELAFAEGAELDERFALDSSDLLGMLGGSSGELAQVFEASASLLDADLQGSFDLQLDVDGRWCSVTRHYQRDEFLYVDTIGLDRQRPTGRMVIRVPITRSASASAMLSIPPMPRSPQIWCCSSRNLCCLPVSLG